MYWPSTQKHILSCFFLSLAFYFCIHKSKTNKNCYNFKIWIFYTLSIFSQPITLFAVIAYILYFKDKLKDKSEITFVIMLALSFLLCLGLNMFYYSEVYPYQAAVDKIVGYGLQLNLANAIFSLSRSFSQIFFPYSFALNYAPISIFSFIGLPVFIVSLVCIYFVGHKRHLLGYIVFAIFPLIPVYSRITNIFISDTYLIWTLLAVVLFSIYFLNKLNRSLNGILYFVIILLSIKAYKEARITSNRSLFFTTSFQREPTCKNGAQLLTHLINEKKLNIHLYLNVTDQFLLNKCHIQGDKSDLITLNLLSVYFYINNKTALNDKIKHLESMPIRTIANDSILILLYEKNGQRNLIEKVKHRLRKNKKLSAAYLYTRHFLNSIDSL
jgi:hypothetical protein